MTGVHVFGKLDGKTVYYVPTGYSACVWFYTEDPYKTKQRLNCYNDLLNETHPGNPKRRSDAWVRLATLRPILTLY